MFIFIFCFGGIHFALHCKRDNHWYVFICTIRLWSWLSNYSYKPLLFFQRFLNLFRSLTYSNPTHIHSFQKNRFKSIFKHYYCIVMKISIIILLYTDAIWLSSINRRPKTTIKVKISRNCWKLADVFNHEL